MTEPAPGVVLFVETGYLSADFAAKIIQVYENAIRQSKRPHVFVDCEALDGYAPPIRTETTAWLRENHTRLAAVHMLVRSHITKMGFAVINLMLGGVMHGYTDRASFQAALRQAITRAGA